jgi:hypothetical protein
MGIKPQIIFALRAYKIPLGSDEDVFINYRTLKAASASRAAALMPAIPNSKVTKM